MTVYPPAPVHMGWRGSVNVVIFDFRMRDRDWKGDSRWRLLCMGFAAMSVVISGRSGAGDEPVGYYIKLKFLRTLTYDLNSENENFRRPPGKLILIHLE